MADTMTAKPALRVPASEVVCRTGPPVVVSEPGASEALVSSVDGVPLSMIVEMIVPTGSSVG
jgi:hypothetical protein